MAGSFFPAGETPAEDPDDDHQDQEACQQEDCEEGWVQYRAENWKESIEALEKSCTLQMGGDGGQWIVISLCHAKLAIESERPQEQRTRHQDEARRFYDQAVKSIDGWILGTDPWAETFRGFRAEATALLEVKQLLT